MLKVGESAEGYHLLGYIAQQTGRHSLSIDSCIRANDLGLEDWGNHLILGLSHMALGKHDSARDAFEVAHRMSPLSTDAAVYFLKATLAAKGLEAAESVYQSFSPALQAGRLRHLWRATVAENQVAAIRRLMRAGRFDEAEDACRKILKKLPVKSRIGYLATLGTIIDGGNINFPKTPNFWKVTQLPSA